MSKPPTTAMIDGPELLALKAMAYRVSASDQPARADRRALLDATPRLLAEVDRLRERVAELEKDSEFIEALMAAGVDNWEGYGHAQDIFSEWQNGGAK